jgi:membrane protease YdiL (CAAX protease family)
MLGLAAALYGVFAAGAFLWAHLAGRSPLWDSAVFSWSLCGLGLAAGLALGLLTVGLSRLLVARLAWARSLYLWFREVLGPLTIRQVAALALLSSVGEELLFRGAMQPALGLWLTTLIFAALHFPSRLSLWPWTVMAALLGLLFGLLTLWSGNVAGATLAHFVINLLNLRHITRIPAEKLLGPMPAPSMEHHEPPSSVDPGPSAPAPPDAG